MIDILVRYSSKLSAFLLEEEPNNREHSNKNLLEYECEISSAIFNKNTDAKAKIYINTFETFKEGLLCYLNERENGKEIKFNIKHLDLNEQSLFASLLYRLEKEANDQDYSFEFKGNNSKRDFYSIGFNPVFISIKFENDIEFKLATDLQFFVTRLKELEQLYPEETEILVKHLAFHIEKPENTHENIYVLATNILAYLDDSKNKYLKEKWEYDYLQIARNRFFNVAAQLMDDEKIEEAGVYWIKLLKDDKNCVSKYFKREGEVFCALVGKSEIKKALNWRNKVLYPFINRNKETGMVDKICYWYLWRFNIDAAIKIFLRRISNNINNNAHISNVFFNIIIKWLKKFKVKKTIINTSIVIFETLIILIIFVSCLPKKLAFLLTIILLCLILWLIKTKNKWLKNCKYKKNLYPRINATFITFLTFTTLIAIVYWKPHTYAFLVMIIGFCIIFLLFLVGSLIKAKLFKITSPSLIISLAGAWLTVILVTDEHWRSFILVTPLKAIISGIFFILFIYIYLRSQVEEKTQVNVPYFTRGSKIISFLLYAFLISYGFGAVGTTFMGNKLLLYTGVFDEPQFHKDYRELGHGISNVCEEISVTNEIYIAGEKYAPYFIEKKHENSNDYVEAQVKKNPLLHLTKCSKYKVAVKLNTRFDWVNYILEKIKLKDKYFFPWFVLYKSFSALLIGVLFSSFINKKEPSDSI